MANFDVQLQRMKSLMTYGAVKENKKQTCGAMEYHAIGADGKAYGIIRENQKFYIKTADKKNELVVEAYNYIGGFNNKKQYEYSGLSEAKKNFDMKLKSIKEANSVKVTTDTNKFAVLSESMSVCGKSMMNEIARQRQIMANAAAIMNESSAIGVNNTGTPEAPKTTSFNAKAGAPFTETATAELHDDFKKTANSPEKQGEPFGDGAKTENMKDAEYVPQGSVANQKPKGGKAVKVDEATMKVLEMMHKLDGSFKINEADEEIAGMESDVEFVDDRNETDMEDMSDVEAAEAPEMETEDDFDFEMFDDDMEGEEAAEEDMEDNLDTEEEGEEAAEEDMENHDEESIEDLKARIEALEQELAELKGEESEIEYEVEADEDELEADEDELEDEEAEEEVIPECNVREGVEDVAMPEWSDKDVEALINKMENDTYPNGQEEEEEFMWDTYGNQNRFDDEGSFGMAAQGDENQGLVTPEWARAARSCDADFDNEQYWRESGVMPESRKSQLNPIVESFVKQILKEERLNDFGKHPGYRKKTMSLPATGSDEGDWNDESVYSEAPFGQKIGSSAPFDEKMVEKVTDMVMEIFKKKI